MSVTVLLAHRYPVVREGLKAVFARHTDIRVIGETDNGLDVVTLAARLHPDGTLTTREREVLHLAAEGRTYTEIAAALGIRPSTVETHRAHLMQKLGLRTKTDLIRYALRRGILPMET